MTTQEDILLPRARQKRMRQQVIDTKPVNQADMTYVSDDGDPNNAVLQSVYDNAGQRIEGIKGAQGNPNEIDVKGNGIVTTYGQQAVPKGSAIPTAAPNPSGQQVTPDQLVNSKTGVVNVPQGAPLPVSGNPTEQMQPKKSYTYDDMYKMLADQKAEEEKRIKKEKRRNLIATIGNGLSALANLYYTTKGAPSAYTPELSAKMRARYDALEKERRDNDNAYINARLKILGQQKADERAGRDASIKESYYKAKAELEREKQGNDAKMKQQAQDFAHKNAQDKLEEQIRHNKAMEQNADKRTQAYQTSVKNKGTGSSSGRGNGRTWSFKDANGIEHTYTNKAEYDANVKYYGKLGGVTLTEESVSNSSTSDSFGGEKKTENIKVVNKSTSSVAAEMKAKADENKAKAKEREKAEREKAAQAAKEQAAKSKSKDGKEKRESKTKV